MKKRLIQAGLVFAVIFFIHGASIGIADKKDLSESRRSFGQASGEEILTVDVYEEEGATSREYARFVDLFILRLNFAIKYCQATGHHLVFVMEMPGRGSSMDKEISVVFLREKEEIFIGSQKTRLLSSAINMRDFVRKSAEGVVDRINEKNL